MPMNMGIHRKPTGHGRLVFMASRLRGNDGGMCFPRKRLSVFLVQRVGRIARHPLHDVAVLDQARTSLTKERMAWRSA